MTKTKILNYLIIVGVLMSAVPCAVAAMNEIGTEDHIKVLDKERRLAIVEATSTAHLKNDVLDLYFTEQNSDLWKYQWQPGQWGESCYHEHFGVYTDDAGRTLESEEFTIDQSFTDPGGVPGTVTAILHYGDVQVKRKITLISGDIRFFEIEYTIKNTGASTIDDVRFFQTIDFDIPQTGDHTDDHAWYDAEHDYVVVKDDEFFENSFKARRDSTRHGIDYWHTEIYDDWDDGNLNNANSYGPGDPAIGMQYNLGSLVAGEEEIVAITVWSGEPTEEMEPEFNSITFGDERRISETKKNHHTVGKDYSYPPEYIVLRRGQNFDLKADIENFDDGDHKIIFEITKPDGTTQKLPAARKDGTLGSGWDCTYTCSGQNFNFKIHIPGNCQVGNYQLNGEIQKKDGDITYDDEDAPEFYVIFNPWSSEDVEVYNPDFSEKELKHYVLGKNGYNFYRGDAPNYALWILAPQSKEVFDISIEEVSGKTSARDASKDLACKASSCIDGCWGGCNHEDQNFKCDWSKYNGIPALISKYNSGKVVYGQCMDYEALLNAFQRSTGIPARMLTAYRSGHDKYGSDSFNEFIDDKFDIFGHMCCGSERWGFHCWDEMWLNNEWHSVDATYRKGPSSRNNIKISESEYDLRGHTPNPEYCILSNAFIHDEISLPTKAYLYSIRMPDKDEPHSATGIYTYNAEIESPEAILDDYLDPTPHEVSRSLLTIDIPLTVDVSCNSSTYQIGENINATLFIKNIQTESITVEMGFAVYEEELSTGECIRDIFNDTKTITIPADSTYKYNYLIPYGVYKHAGNYVASAGAYNASMAIADIDRTRVTITGSQLIISAPQIVTINETFAVSLTVENVLDTPMNTVDVHGYFSYFANVSGAPENFTISTLAPHATNTTTWYVSLPVAGTYPIGFDVFSNETGLSHNSTMIGVMSDPFLRVDIEVPSSVQKDSTFAVNVTIVNEGDLAADDVQSELTLPPELTTSDDLIKPIGTIDPHANTIIVWNITATEAGTSAFTIVTSSSTDSGEDVIFIPIFIYDHDLVVSVEESQIAADGDLHIINMTIHNLGNVEDSVLLQYLVTNPDISFSIYDGDERIIAQPVTVPANGDKILNLKIIPEYEASGEITIHATSELDPTASDSTSIEVSIPLIISDVTNTTPTTNSVTITWTTDKVSDSVVKYGTDSGSYPNNESNTTMATSHSITLTGLSADTTYYFVVNSTDANGTSAESAEYSFTTLAEPSTTTISIADASASSNHTTTTPITINNMTNFGAATVTISYNPTVVQITNITAGDVGTPIANINNTAGTATMVAYVSTVTGPNSPITFANLELLAVGNNGETSPLTLTITTLTDADGTPISATAESGVFTISGLRGDANDDGLVNVVDAMFVAQYAVGNRDASTLNMANADANLDGDVNVVDAMFIAQYAVGARTW